MITFIIIVICATALLLLGERLVKESNPKLEGRHIISLFLGIWFLYAVGFAFIPRTIEKAYWNKILTDVAEFKVVSCGKSTNEDHETESYVEYQVNGKPYSAIYYLDTCIIGGTGNIRYYKFHPSTYFIYQSKIDQKPLLVEILSLVVLILFLSWPVKYIWEYFRSWNYFGVNMFFRNIFRK